MKIRVLYIADSLMAGGIESQLVELATRLDRSLFEPALLALYGPTQRALHFAPAIRAAGLPLYTPDLRGGARDKAAGVAQIARAAWRLRPHLIQAEGYHANLLMRLAAPALPPTRLIGSVRGVLTPKQLLYERLSHRLCARIVVNAPHLKRMLASAAGVPPRKIVHIPNGITVERYATPHDATLRARLAPDARRVYVAMGRISVEKNMHWIAQAFGLLKRQGRLPDDIRCFIVGPQQEPSAQVALDEALDRDGLRSVVIQREATPSPQDYYHASDLCILYSPNEGLPNVSIEALAARRPLIVSQAANAAEVIEDGVTGWIVPTGDIAALAETLYATATAPEATLRAMQDACAARAERYTVGALVSRYTELYQSLAALAATSPGR